MSAGHVFGTARGLFVQVFWLDLGWKFHHMGGMISSRPFQFLILLFALFGVSCSATYHASGRVTRKGSVLVTHERKDSGDANVRAAIRSELIKRGFTLTESERSDFVLRFRDTWRWNVLMYLTRLELKIVDRRSNGAVQGEAIYRSPVVQTYPSAKNVVAKLFAKWDEAGTFGR
jgi:hypothetical protein